MACMGCPIGGYTLLSLPDSENLHPDREFEQVYINLRQIQYVHVALAIGRPAQY
jgi:hypothetical protein